MTKIGIQQISEKETRHQNMLFPYFQNIKDIFEKDFDMAETPP